MGSWDSEAEYHNGQLNPVPIITKEVSDIGGFHLIPEDHIIHAVYIENLYWKMAQTSAYVCLKMRCGRTSESV